MWRRLPVLLVVGMLALAGCSSSGSEGPSASVTAPPTSEHTTTTKVLTPEQQVEAAYLKSWDVYAKAVRDLDPSGLDESYAEEQLKRTTDAVAAYRARGVAVRVLVDHDYRIEVVRADLAIVRDHYRNHSVLIDPKTGNPKEDDPNDEYTETYTLKEIGDRWLVTDIARAS